MAAGNHTNRDEGLTTSKDTIVAYIQAHTDGQEFRKRFDELFDLYFWDNWSQFESELRAWRQEIADAQASRARNDPPRITTGMLVDPRTPEERALDEWQAEVKETEFGTREWFNSLPEIPF